MSYPTALSNLSEVSTTDTMDAHRELHNSEIQSLNALETKVGVDGSSDTNSIDYKLDGKASKITSGVENNLVSIDDSENIKDSGYSVIDDDTMATASATTLATSESIKAYVDTYGLIDSIHRQAIINGNFDVDQRVGPYTAGRNNDDVYTLDHWNLISDGNDVFDVSQEAITDLPGSNYAIKLDVETAKRGGIVQFLEAKDAQKFKGKTVSISFAVKSANISALRATVLSWASTADSITSDVVGTWAATPTWATNWADNATPADLTVTSSWTTVKVEGIVLDEATVNNLALVIWTPNEETIGDIVYITQVQLCAGEVALPFMPKSYEEELRACMRYFQLIPAGSIGSIDINTTTQSNVGIIYKVPMRLNTPTVALINGNFTNFLASEGVGFYSPTNVIVSLSGFYGIQLRFTGHAPGTANNMIFVYKENLGISTEL